MATYKVLTGLNYGNKRVEAGEVVSDIPATSVRWLTEQNMIELVESKTTSKKATIEEKKDDE
jgi:hypothetical protein